jgi:RHS repeat-associated protein
MIRLEPRWPSVDVARRAAGVSLPIQQTRQSAAAATWGHRSYGTWPVADGLRSVCNVVNDDLSVGSVENYEPFDGGVFGSPFMFTGEPLDDNGLVYLRARYYSPALGVFLSLDPVEGTAQQATSLNRYGYVAGNVTNLTDLSGLFPVTPECDILGKTAYCTYNRTKALAYAQLYGTQDNNKSQKVGLDIGAGTDCANFASQVLQAGGFLHTERWWYTREGAIEGYVGAKAETWASAPGLFNYLTGTGNYDNISPSASFAEEQVTSLRWKADPESDGTYIIPYPNYVDQFDVQIGDLVFFIFPDRANYIDHVAIVIGWGCPVDWEGNIKCSERIVNAPSEHQMMKVDGLVPWIIDHGLEFLGPRPYNDTGYGERDLTLRFVAIPERFRLKDLRENFC